MRIFITGGEGQLGQAVAAALPADAVRALSRRDADITDPAALAAAFAEPRPDIVVNCAAWTDVDGCARDPDRAHRVNAVGAANVARACQAAGARLIHISSNEVFAGDNPGGYNESQPLDPINPYGRSKAEAEQLIQSILPDAIIIRTAWLFAAGGRNFIHAILRRARAEGALRVVADEVGNPTYVPDLAAAIAELIPLEAPGIYHLTNAGATSRWAFADEILRQAGLAGVTNVPILSRDFRRASTPPRFAALHNNAAAALGITLRPWPEAVATYLAADT